MRQLKVLRREEFRDKVCIVVGTRPESALDKVKAMIGVKRN